jgi:hypothetical protein
MATILGPVGRLIHETAAGLIDNQVPDKLASTVNGFVTSGFGIVTDLLKITRDITKPDSEPTPPQT